MNYEGFYNRLTELHNIPLFALQFISLFSMPLIGISQLFLLYNLFITNTGEIQVGSYSMMGFELYIVLVVTLLLNPLFLMFFAASNNIQRKIYDSAFDFIQKSQKDKYIPSLFLLCSIVLFCIGFTMSTMYSLVVIYTSLIFTIMFSIDINGRICKKKSS